MTEFRRTGTWILKQQYRNGELIFNKPYLRYEFIPPNTWNSYIRQGYDKGLFDFKEKGNYTIKDNKIGLFYWDSDNIDWGTYFIQGDTLLIIEFMYEEGLSKMIFKREMKLPDIYWSIILLLNQYSLVPLKISIAVNPKNFL